jgi:hypothetical protein
MHVAYAYAPSSSTLCMCLQQSLLLFFLDLTFCVIWPLFFALGENCQRVRNCRTFCPHLAYNVDIIVLLFITLCCQIAFCFSQCASAYSEEELHYSLYIRQQSNQTDDVLPNRRSSVWCAYSGRYNLDQLVCQFELLD